MITKAEKSQDQHLASWKHKKTDGTFQSESEDLRNRTAEDVSSSPIAGHLEIQEEAMLPFQSKGRKRPAWLSSSNQAGGVHSYSQE